MFNLIEKHKNISLHLMVVILGITGILGKLITLNAIHLVWYRMLIAFIALLLFLTYKKQANDEIKDTIFSSYDLFLNSKYNIKINEKTLERVKNYFR